MDVQGLPLCLLENSCAKLVQTSSLASIKDKHPAEQQKMTDPNPDYDISQPLPSATGLRQGLTSYGDAHFSLFLRKVFIKALGYSEDALSRPIVGIINTHSGFNPCHANVPQLIEAVKRGVQLSGGLAVDFPTISLHESFSAPTSMFLRNLMSMDTEEMIRAQPCDVVVAIGGGCTIPPSITSPHAHLLTASCRVSRLRQDGPRAANGCAVGKQARAAARNGAHDAGFSPRRKSRSLHGLPEPLGAVPRRKH
jgi:hypothetical protein